MNVRSILVTILILLLPAEISAHGSGVSLEQVDGAMVVDIGYDPEVLVAGERIVFDFQLNSTEGDEIPFDRVWTRLESDGAAYLATGVGRATLGPTTLLVTLPNPSPETITLHVRYEFEGEGIAKASFPLTVQPAEESAPIVPMVSAFLGVVVGFIGYHGFAIWQRRRAR